MIEGKRVLITGGAGFIGSSLALRLVDTCDVVIFDNLHRNALKDTDLAAHPRAGAATRVSSVTACRKIEGPSFLGDACCAAVLATKDVRRFLRTARTSLADAAAATAPASSGPLERRGLERNVRHPKISAITDSSADAR